MKNDNDKISDRFVSALAGFAVSFVVLLIVWIFLRIQPYGPHIDFKWVLIGSFFPALYGFILPERFDKELEQLSSSLYRLLLK